MTFPLSHDTANEAGATSNEKAYLFPASFAQERLWFLDQFEPDSFIYNIPSTLSLKGMLVMPALLQSINTLVQRHETLRTTFVTVDSRPMQSIAPVLDIAIPVVDLSELAKDERTAIIQQIAQHEAQCPFDLVHGPLIRTTLLRLDAEEHLLLLTIHHIIADGWSANIFFKELNILCHFRRRKAFAVARTSHPIR